MATLDLDAVPKTYDEAVRLLAAWHSADEPDMRAWAIPDPNPDAARREVRLIEVSDCFPEGGAMRPDGTGGREKVIPVFPLGASAEFPFRSRVAQVTFSEWDDLRAGTLKLTQDWNVGEAEPVPLNGNPHD